jgi:TPR repeat protein
MEAFSLAEARAAGRSPHSASAEELFHLGLIHSLGIDGPPDLIAAQTWLNLAAMKGSAQARICRRELAAEMSPEQMAEAQRQASLWIAPHP